MIKVPKSTRNTITRSTIKVISRKEKRERRAIRKERKDTRRRDIRRRLVTT